MRLLKAAAATVFSLLLVSSYQAAQAQAVPPIKAPISQLERSPLSDNVRAKLIRGTDDSPVQPGRMLGRMMLMVQPSAEQRAAVQQLLVEQQDRSSPNFDKWLSPEEYAARFGVSHADAENLMSWLRQQGFTQVQVSHTGRFSSFAGTVDAAHNGSATEIHRVTLDGRSHIAKVTPASVPSAIAGVVSAIIGLDDRFSWFRQGFNRMQSIPTSQQAAQAGRMIRRWRHIPGA